MHKETEVLAERQWCSGALAEIMTYLRLRLETVVAAERGTIFQEVQAMKREMLISSIDI